MSKKLAPDSLEAMICSYECTFCNECVTHLENVYPNCGGGFTSRPHRPSKEYRPGTSLLQQPAAEMPVHKVVNLTSHRKFAAPIKHIPSNKR